MKTVQLVNGIKSSVIGFGCAPILGAVGATKAREALDFALECGINHLDLARSYGYGEAETFVGQLIKGKRNSIVLASKFGIVANWKAQLLKPLKPVVRYLRRKPAHEGAPSAAIAVGSQSAAADRFHDRIELRGVPMRKSLEKSLKALNTDHLEYFFVHEPLTKLSYIDELCETADALKSEGKIRAWGLAYNKTQEELHTPYLSRFDVLQFNNSPGAAGYTQTINDRAQFPNVFFSPLRGGSKDLTPNDKLRTLMKDFTKTVILCSMFNKAHILENVNVANE
jgi:aryl-alcohol dehydrogenase-like predicted oxidoreductase